MAQAQKAKEALETEFAREIQANRMDGVTISASPCSIIAAVGDGMRQTSGVSARFFGALGDAKINVLAVAQGRSDRNISAVVLEADSSRGHSCSPVINQAGRTTGK